MPSQRRIVATVLAIGVVVAGGVVAFSMCRPTWDDPAIAWPAQVPACDGFDYPVGPPDGEGWQDMLAFGVEDRLGTHLGNDWTMPGDDNADLGARVYAITAGVVIDARDIGYDWGNVVRIAHGCGVESVYAHLQRIDTRVGATVKRGDAIGTLGNANGTYSDAHLHLELRDRPLPLGGGYRDSDEQATGYLDPTWYIKTHRPSQQR